MYKSNWLYLERNLSPLFGKKSIIRLAKRYQLFSLIFGNLSFILNLEGGQPTLPLQIYETTNLLLLNIEDSSFWDRIAVIDLFWKEISDKEGKRSTSLLPICSFSIYLPPFSLYLRPSFFEQPPCSCTTMTIMVVSCMRYKKYILHIILDKVYLINQNKFTIICKQVITNMLNMLRPTLKVDSINWIIYYQLKKMHRHVKLSRQFQTYNKKGTTYKLVANMEIIASATVATISLLFKWLDTCIMINA